MQASGFAALDPGGMAQDQKRPSPPPDTAGGARSSSPTAPASGRRGQDTAPTVFVFNPFAEGYIARGRAFAPTKHQTLLAADLANLPQFLGQRDDVVLVAERPSAAFLHGLQRAGFSPPEFVELRNGRLDPAGNLCRRRLGRLRPWAWGPDSVTLLAPLLARLEGDAHSARDYFNNDIARLYSKAWSAAFLRKVLASCRAADEPSAPGPTWLCSELEAGTAVETLEEALGAIAAIRSRGHHRVLVKEAYGLAGHNAVRLWEPEILPAQRQWLAHALRGDRPLVVEPWLEREMDFSVQLEMGARGLELCGYTGLLNDPKGQFLGNWAEAEHPRCLPARVATLLGGQGDIAGRLLRLYGEIFSVLEAELQRVGFEGPVSIDALVYRAPEGGCRVKPVVEINPRYTMGRLTVELMRRACPGSSGLFRLITQAQARAAGFHDLASYARGLAERAGLRLEGAPITRLRQGALCLNDPGQAQVCLATFEVQPTAFLPGAFAGPAHPRPD